MNDLVQSRGGGSGLWRLEGNIVALATGRVLAGVLGVEEVKVARPMHRVEPKNVGKSKRLPLDGSTDSKDQAPITHAATLLVRNSLLYTQPDSNSTMTEFRLRPTTPARRVDPVLPNASRVRVARRSDGTVEFARLSNAKANEGNANNNSVNDDVDDDSDTNGNANGVLATRTVMRGGPRHLGAGMRRLLVASWAYVGRRVSTTPSSRSGAPAFPAVVERCDYTVSRHTGVWYWSRVGRCPPWYGRGQCVTYLTANKVANWRDIDPTIRTLLAQTGRTPLAQRPQRTEGSDIGEAADNESVAKSTQTLVQSRQSPTQRKRWLGLF